MRAAFQELAMRSKEVDQKVGDSEAKHSHTSQMLEEATEKLGKAEKRCTEVSHKHSQ